MTNPPEKINWGIIGCGDVCEVKSGPAFNKISGSSLVAVMRRDEAKVKDYATRHGVAKYYTEAAALINDEEVNAVYIATPPSSHELYTRMALQAGKPVYVEKPVSTDAASIERMIAAEQQYKGKVVAAHYRRGLSLFIKIKELITTGAVGDIRLILLKLLQPSQTKLVTETADNWRLNPAISGGGLFHDLSPHQLDILYWIFGAPLFSSVKAINQGKQYDAPDLTLVQLEFSKGICFSGTWDFNASPAAADETCAITGTKGKIVFSFFKEPRLQLITDNGTDEFSFEYPVNIQHPFIEQTVQYFLGQRENPCSLHEALVMMKVIEQSVC